MPLCASIYLRVHVSVRVEMPCTRSKEMHMVGANTALIDFSLRYATASALLLSVSRASVSLVPCDKTGSRPHLHHNRRCW